MRLRALAPLALCAAAIALAACGGGDGSKDPHAKRFNDNCSSCHTLKAAGATGRVGPDLDDLRPPYAAVVKQVTNGGGGMPSFKGKFSTAEIQDLAHWVARVAGKG